MKSVIIPAIGLCLGLIATAMPKSVNALTVSTRSIETVNPNQVKLAQIPDLDNSLSRANALFDAGKYGEAIKAYTLIIRKEFSGIPQPQARLKRSRAYVLATVYGSPGYDDYDQAVGAAIADCIRVINFEPSNPSGYYCRGYAYSYIFSHEAAFADFDRAIALAPNDVTAHYERGNAYIRSDRLDRVDRAIADFTEVIKLDPRFADAYYSRGLAYTYVRPADLQSANADFNQAIKLAPREVSYYQARGKARYAIKDFQGAIEDNTKVIQSIPSANSYSDRGDALAAFGKADEALADYNQAIALNSTVAYYGRGLVRAKRGDRKGAMSDLEQAKRNYQENMGKGNFDKPEYQRILKALEQLQQKI